VLVVEHDDVFAGLLVDEVFGLQHFAQDSLEALPADELQGRWRRSSKAISGRAALAGVQPVCAGAIPGFMNVAL
jgi:twitching motility protein PilI